MEEQAICRVHSSATDLVIADTCTFEHAGDSHKPVEQRRRFRLSKELADVLLMHAFPKPKGVYRLWALEVQSIGLVDWENGTGEVHVRVVTLL